MQKCEIENKKSPKRNSFVPKWESTKDQARYKRVGKKFIEYWKNKTILKKEKDNFATISKILEMDYTQFKRVYNGFLPEFYRKRKIGTRYLSDVELNKLEDFLDNRFGYDSGIKKAQFKPISYKHMKHWTCKTKKGILCYIRCIGNNIAEVYASEVPTDDPVLAIKGKLIDRVENVKLRKTTKINKTILAKHCPNFCSLLQS